GDIDKFVLPGMQRDYFARVAGKQIRDDAALHCSDDLLPLRRKWRNLQIDLVAARLLVIGSELLDRGILFWHEALRPPHFRGFRLRIGEIRAGQRRSRHKADRTANNRASRDPGHRLLLPARAASL